MMTPSDVFEQLENRLDDILRRLDRESRRHEQNVRDLGDELRIIQGECERQKKANE